MKKVALYILEVTMKKKLAIFAAPSSVEFTGRICHKLKIEPGKMRFKQFSDGEWWCQFLENIRDRHVFLVSSTIAPVDNWFHIWMMIDAARRASAGMITAVIPYFGYGRQERKDKPRVPITAKMVASFTEFVGADRIVTMDLHASATQGFCQIPFDHLYGTDVLIAAIKKCSLLKNQKIVGIAPDEGSLTWVVDVCNRYGWRYGLVPKKRAGHNLVEDLNLPVLGRVKGETCLIMDDMADTLGTMSKASEKLVKAGAKAVYAIATHPVLSGDALKVLSKSSIIKLWVGDTIPLSVASLEHQKIQQVSVAPLFAKAIDQIFRHRSVTSLFPNQR